jgi:DNA-binding NtrC family response regulator
MGMARVLVVDDDPAIRKIVADRVKALGHEVQTAENGKVAVEKAEAFAPHLVLTDMKMPLLDGFGVLAAMRARRPPPEVVMFTAHGNIEVAVQAVRQGASDFLAKPFEGAHLDHVVERALERAGLKRRIERLETELSARHTLVHGASAGMQRVLALAERAAASEATVLLLGESGTGKEVLARHIHALSGRASGPFVAVNCATLSAELLESELFGHDKGAFTGATRDKPGRIELAAGGTLFLDEIGELAANVQAKLLRVLQEREFERVGGTRTLSADVRVIAATHRDLRQAIADGRFREDLFYRLNVVSLVLPALRDRREDLPALLEHALERACREAGRRPMTVSPAALELLSRYDWPGNVRELGNVVERAVVLSPADSIEVDDLPEEIRELAGAPAEASPSAPGAAAAAPATQDGEPLPYNEAVAAAKRRIVLDALARTDGHQTRAAELLGLRQPYLSRLMKNLGIR